MAEPETKAQYIKRIHEKRVKTTLKNHGKDHFKNLGKRRGRGYFGKLKDEGNTDELRRLQSKGRKNRVKK